MEKIKSNKLRLLIDGNDFKPFMMMINNNYTSVNHICIEGGDNKYSCISAASILAKVERDKYIKDICLKYPKLAENGFMIFHDYAIGKKPINKEGKREIVNSEWGETRAVDDFLKDKIETVVIDSIPFMQKGKEIPKKIENIPKNEFSSYGKK